MKRSVNSVPFATRVARECGAAGLTVMPSPGQHFSRTCALPWVDWLVPGSAKEPSLSFEQDALMQRAIIAMAREKMFRIVDKLD